MGGKPPINFSSKCTNGRAGAARVAPEIPLYHIPANLSIGNLHKV